VDWPTSVETEAVGLVDVYRALHPDPVKHPGITWPAVSTTLPRNPDECVGV